VITAYDYLNIAFYFAFVAGVGIYFSRRSKDTSDYFRGGGLLPWWVTGAGAWMSAFSAWTFTGAAGKIYQTGPYVLVLYYGNVAGLFAILFFTAQRFRRLRVVTPFEAIRLRYGPGMQQFYTWVRLPVAVVFTGMMLNAVGIFMSAVFGVNLTITLVALGTLVTLVSLLGGSFAVAASDFVQMLLVVTVTVAVAVLALAEPSIGGVSGLVARVPAVHFEWGQIARPGFIAGWFLAMTVNSLLVQNSLSDERATKYMMARSDRHARLMLIIPIVGTIVTPLLWIIPPMVAAVRHPDIATLFPQLKHPEEAAFLLTAHDVLPQGMLGLLVCGIFAATLTHSDAILNQGAGMLVRNFYLPVIDPDCPEKKLLKLSKLATAALGAAVIAFAVFVGRYRSLGLFDLLNQLGIALLLPLALPACLGMFFKRTPWWSAWTTVVIGLAVSGFVSFRLTPGMIPGLPAGLKPEEATVFANIATVALGATIPVAWFFCTTFFYDRSTPEYKASVEEFFRRLATPLPDVRDAGGENHVFPQAIGRCCLLFGGFVMLFAFVPNALRGRLCFLACGGAMFLIGVLLVRLHPATARRS
jgi:SSS family solute:Na+ symporter